MIISLRSFDWENIQGVQILVCKFWRSPVEDLAFQCFENFDSAWKKISHDPDITMIKPSPEISKNSLLTKLHTTELNTLSTLALKVRNNCRLWTLIHKDRKIFGNYPAWTQLNIEDTKGNLFEIKNKNPSDSICDYSLMSDDSLAHLAINLNPSNLEFSELHTNKIHTFRFSTFLQNQIQNNKPILSMELKL